MSQSEKHNPRWGLLTGNEEAVHAGAAKVLCSVNIYHYCENVEAAG